MFIKCKKCNKNITIPSQTKWKKGRCPNCGNVIIIAHTEKDSSLYLKDFEVVRKYSANLLVLFFGGWVLLCLCFTIILSPNITERDCPLLVWFGVSFIVMLLAFLLYRRAYISKFQDQNYDLFNRIVWHWKNSSHLCMDEHIDECKQCTSYKNEIISIRKETKEGEEDKEVLQVRKFFIFFGPFPFIISIIAYHFSTLKIRGTLAEMMAIVFSLYSITMCVKGAMLFVTLVKKDKWLFGTFPFTSLGFGFLVAWILAILMSLNVLIYIFTGIEFWHIKIV